MRFLIAFVLAFVVLDSLALSIEKALESCRLATAGQYHSYVTVFNELEALDDAADRAWLDLPDRASYDRYRVAMRDELIAAMGGFPERTPLNARTVASFQKDGYRIEKVIFESMQGIHVTANLFIPAAPEFRAPYPAIVMSCGHSEEGKDSPTYLRACVLAVKAGFVAFMFDPYAQGERRIDGPDPWSTRNHTQIGLRAALLGGSAAQLRVWDALRAVDYVESRPEVDRTKLGYMGNSGGGTLSALMTAIDRRLKVTAPSCFLTSLTSLCEHMGPQDGEQNVFGQLAFGLNHTGLVLIPDIKVAVTCKFADMFTYYGTRRLFRTVETVSKRVGSSGNYWLNDAPGVHEWSEATKAASVEWMRVWLKGERGRLPIDKTEFRIRDLGFDLADGVELGLASNERGCTPTGRTHDLPDERGIFEVLRERARKVVRNRRPLPDGDERSSLVRRLASIRLPADVKTRIKELGAEEAEGCVIMHLAFLYPSGLALPAELIVRKGSTPKAVTISVGRKGRGQAFADARALLSENRAVLVSDLTGLGSIGRGRYVFYGAKECPEEGTSVMLYLMGESMIGRRATDLLVLSEWLRNGNFEIVDLLAADDVAISAAHAAVADPIAFSSLKVLRQAPSWASAFDSSNDEKYILYYTTIVNGAYNHYDWTDLLDNL